MQKYAMLYEIMEIAGLVYADDAARWNAVPHEARAYPPEDRMKDCGCGQQDRHKGKPVGNSEYDLKA